jgi:hypothetical protein
VNIVTKCVYNKIWNENRNAWASALSMRITKPMSTGGRPTDDPKGTLIAVRLSARQVHVLALRSRQEDTGLSEAIRRCVDEWAADRATQPRSTKPSRRAKEAGIKQPSVVSKTRPVPSRKHRSAK